LGSDRILEFYSGKDIVYNYLFILEFDVDKPPITDGIPPDSDEDIENFLLTEEAKQIKTRKKP
jgi:hypothetical protein